MNDAIGWLSSLILMLTIIVQIRKQWTKKTSEGVSHWMFGGQVLSCAGFAIYSYLEEYWVFVFTNVFLFITNIVGFWMTLKFKKSET